MSEILAGRCGQENCHVENLVRLNIRGQTHKWARLRAPTVDYNIARKHFREQERPTLASISAARQRRLDEVLELWDAGSTPQEIKKILRLRNELVYQYLAACGIDPKPRATEARDQLHERIGELLNEGMTYKEIARILDLTSSKVGYICRTHFKLDGRKRRAASNSPMEI